MCTCEAVWVSGFSLAAAWCERTVVDAELSELAIWCFMHDWPYAKHQIVEGGQLGIYWEN